MQLKGFILQIWNVLLVFVQFIQQKCLKTSLDFEHFLAKHECFSVYITHDRMRLCLKVSQSSWRKLSGCCVYYTFICWSPEKHVVSHVAVHTQNTHCTQPLVNMKCFSQHFTSIMYIIIQVTGIHVDVNSSVQCVWLFVHWDDKKCALQTRINVCENNSFAAIFLFVNIIQ